MVRQVSYKFRDALLSCPIMRIDIEPSWHSQHPEPYIGATIVISVGFFPPLNFDDDVQRPKLLSAMLIEWVEGAEDMTFCLQLWSGCLHLVMKKHSTNGETV